MKRIFGTLELAFDGAGEIKNINTGRTHKTWKTHQGYIAFSGKDLDGKSSQFLLHRAIWETFKKRIPSGKVINHLNGNKEDNSIGNLEVTSHSGNAVHARDVLGRNRKHLRKLNDLDIKELRRRYSRGDTLREISQGIGVTPSALSNIVRQKSKSYKEHSGTFTRAPRINLASLRKRGNSWMAYVLIEGVQKSLGSGPDREVIERIVTDFNNARLKYKRKK